MDVRVAVKVAFDSGKQKASYRERFKREAKAGNLLGKEPEFVRAFDWGEHKGHLCLAMDLVEDARPLDLSSGSLEERLARLSRAAAIVAEAHSRRIIHRDLKPQNFLQGASWFTGWLVHSTKFQVSWRSISDSTRAAQSPVWRTGVSATPATPARSNSTRAM